MTTSAEPVEPTADPTRRPRPAVVFTDVLSDDGTRLRAWSNDPDDERGAPTVLLCNGLGTNAFAWPALLDPDCGVRVISWNHRGIGGSARPSDPERVDIAAFVEDALSVMDHYGVDRAVAVGWSIGVNTMFELAVRHPERVSGLFAVAGVPGDTFATMLGPLRLPRAAARAATLGFSHAVRLSGRVLSPVARRLPIGPRTVGVLSHSGFMFRVADVDLTAAAIREFLQVPLDWYFHVALRTSEHPRVRLSQVQVPAVFVAGRWDLMAGARHMAQAAARVDDATYVELPGSHFIQMEQPERVHALLVDFLRKVG